MKRTEASDDAAFRVLQALGDLYSTSAVGSRPEGGRDFIVDLSKLLGAANCRDGDDRAEAEACLRSLHGSLLFLEGPRRDPGIIHRVRVKREQESVLFTRIGGRSPSQQRQALSDQFGVAASYVVPERWRVQWLSWCASKRKAALEGLAVGPFDKVATDENEEVLLLLPKLLAWEGESLVRFVSCVLCGNSKRLEELTTRDKEGPHAGQLRGKLGRLLEEVTGGQVRCLNDIGILHNPRSVLLHGPLVLEFGEGRLDLNLLESPIRLGLLDVKRAQAISSTADKCLTVENETTFHELAKLHSGVLLICTSYPGRATLALMERLPKEMQFWHFGDSDEAGFDIHRVLRERTARAIEPLHMERGRVPFEQEALGRPALACWPFYKLNRE
ncbi:MAG: hypothetical protein IPP83_13460 [Flavobacteriales bacterium]|nr:hypothetical protein [Flavobacteriales bacterium]